LNQFPRIRLGDLCDKITDGTHHSPSNLPQGAFKYITAKNIKPWGLDLSELTYVDEETHREIYARCDVRKGDILYIKDGATTGIAAINPLEEEFSLLSSVGVLRPGAAIRAKYLLYALQDPATKARMMDGIAGVAITRLTLRKLNDATVPVAPLALQDRIVAKLEELLSDLDAGVAELKAAQKKLAQYRQSLLKAAVEGALTAEWRTRNTPAETGAQLLERILTERRARWEAKQLARFKEQGKTPPKDWQKKYPEPVQPDTTGLPELPQGWVWATIDQISSDERYSLSIGPFGSNLKVPDYRESGTPLVFVRNIRSGNYGGTSTKYVTPEKAEELKAHSIEAGDVLITKMGEPPGDADVYPDGQPPAIITADCIKVRCWAGLMRPDFLKITINSYIGQRQIEPMTQGVAQKKVSLGRFTSLAVPVPSIQEQDRLMALVSAANGEAISQEAAIVFSLKQSTAQRQNILRAAFEGQLVPQDPNDEPANVLLARIRAERAAREAVKKPRGRKAREAA